ncbi:MAG: hypothetical protein GC151_06445 [Betaproteobacteria bacterium]|nr:hypothetical protein [Betaproteobacteria bacterium]
MDTHDRLGLLSFWLAASLLPWLGSVPTAHAVDTIVVAEGDAPDASSRGDTEPAEPDFTLPPLDSASTGQPSDVTGLPDVLGGEQQGLRLVGFAQQTTAYTYADPGHWSTAVFRAQVGSSGRIGPNLKWHASVRGEFDPVYAWTDYYPDNVRRDQRVYGLIGETYIDTSLKGWDLRLGRQNVVWGEMVGLFFADVVTAKDLREFILPSFDVIRIPQWAARGEYFWGDSHVELLWIPYTSFDRIGKPGAEFYPFQVPAPPGFVNRFQDDQIPARSVSNSNVGARFTTLQNGWDLSAFFYKSMDSSATFYREVIPTGPASGTILYTPRHDRIWQTGGTVSKDASTADIVKAELVFTSGRSFNVTRLGDADGVVAKDTIDYAIGVDHTLPEDAKLNVQFFQRVYFNHDPDMLQDQFESGFTVRYKRPLRPKLDAVILWIQSINRWENLVRPRITWDAGHNLHIAFGIDIFNGPVTGFLGRFRDRDRIYVESRYDF